jgi:hypothetical protein
MLWIVIALIAGIGIGVAALYLIATPPGVG